MLAQTFYAEFPAFVRRFFLSLAALAIGYGAGFGTDGVMRGLFRLGSKTEGTLIWFAIFSIFGWLVFALPVLVISPWRKLFRRVGWSGLVGGVVGAGLFVNTAAILSRGELLREPRGWELIGMFGSYAFIIGFVATGSYVWLCGKTRG